MKYGLTSTPKLHTNDWVVIGFFEEDKLPDFLSSSEELQITIQHLQKSLLECGDSISHAGINGPNILSLHCGKKEKYSTNALNKRIAEIAAILFKHRVTSATVALPQLSGLTPDAQLQQMILQFEFERYQFLDYKTQNQSLYSLQSLQFYLVDAQVNTVQIAEGIAEGISFARNLANLPSNICTPTFLANQAIELAQLHEHMHAKIIGPDEMHQMGMGALLGVAQGSNEPPQLIEMQYLGGGDRPPVVLVGKGITFDSGGLTLKPGDAMTEMKYDMAGAASVFGTIKACMLLHLPINVVGLVASAENLPSGTAMKPGDVLTSLSGQTIEVINTDAEGRLVLADALTYAERFKPYIVIDIATLTGAVVVALGNLITGLMTKDDELATLIMGAAEQSGEKTWRLPIDEEYQDRLDSPIADMINAAFDRTAGSIVAACFLSRFTANYRWAHLDIAGTGWISGKKRTATGRPVSLLIQLLRHVIAN